VVFRSDPLLGNPFKNIKEFFLAAPTSLRNVTNVGHRKKNFAFWKNDVSIVIYIEKVLALVSSGKKNALAKKHFQPEKNSIQIYIEKNTTRNTSFYPADFSKITKFGQNKI